MTKNKPSQVEAIFELVGLRLSEALDVVGNQALALVDDLDDADGDLLDALQDVVNAILRAHNALARARVDQ